MRKKWLATLLSLAMVLSLLPTWAIATGEDIASVDALKLAASTNGSYKLTANLELTDDLTVTSNVTFDLNGKMLTIPAGVTLTVQSNLKIVNSLSTAGGVTNNGDISVESGLLDVSELSYSYGGVEGGLIAATPGTLHISSGATVKYMDDWAHSPLLPTMDLLVENNHRIAIAEVGAIAYLGDTMYYCTEASVQDSSTPFGYSASEWSTDVPVAQVGNKAYATLAAAVAAAEDGDTIKLADNVTLSSTVEINNDLTIDLNGHNITGGSVRALWFKNGESTITGAGTITSATNGGSSVIRVGEGANDNSASLTVDEGVVVETTGSSYGITVFSGAKGGRGKDVTLVMNGTVKSKDMPAISGCGNAENGKTYITVNGKVTTENENAIYFPCDGKLVVNGTVTGDGGIEMKAGTAEVMVGEVNIGADAVITATGTVRSNPGNHNDGCSTLGYALAAVENSGYLGKPTIIVNGGTINGTVGVFVDSEVDESKKATITITGGTFSSNVNNYCAEGYECTGSDTTWTVTEKEGYFKAQIGSTKYSDLQTAINAATDGQTITLLSDVTVEEQITINSGKNIVLDLNGKTISTGTTNNLFLIDGAALELTGEGKIDLKGDATNTAAKSARAYYGIQLKGSAEDVANYSVLTVGENVTIIGTNTYGVQALRTGDADQNNFGIVVDVAGRIEATYGMTVNGYFKNTTGNVPKITVKQGAYCHGIYAAGYGVYNVYGKVESTDYGIGIKAGKLNVYDGAYIHCTGPDATPTTPNGNGVEASGAALQIEGTAGYAGEIEINISGGTLESDNGVAVYEYGEAVADTIKSLSITGGELKTGSTNTKYTSDFYVPESFNETGFITGGTFSTEPNATYLATGYEVTEKGGKYVVSKESSVQVEKELPAAFELLENYEIEQITKNTAVANVETHLDELLVNVSGTVAETLATKLVGDETGVNKEAVKAEVSGGSFSTYVKVAPTNAGLNDDAKLKLTFNVTPMLKVNVGGTVLTTELKPTDFGGAENFAKSIAFRLPLTDEFSGMVKVTHHIGENNSKEYYKQVQGEDGGRYVELLVDHFCEFDVEPEADPIVAKVDGAEYKLSQFIDAVHAAENGNKTIELCGDVVFVNTEIDYGPGQMVTEYLTLTKDINVKRNGYYFSVYHKDSNATNPDDRHYFVFVDEPTELTISAVVTESARADKKFGYNDPITVNIVLKNGAEFVESYAGVYAEVTFDPDYVTVETAGTGWEPKTTGGADGVYVFYDKDDGTAENGVLGTFTLTATGITPAGGDDIATINNAQFVNSVEGAYSGAMIKMIKVNGSAEIIGALKWFDRDGNALEPNEPIVEDKTYDGAQWSDYTAIAKGAENVTADVTLAYFNSDGTAFEEGSVPTHYGDYYVQFTATASGYDTLTTDKIPFSIGKATLTVSFTKGDNAVFDGTDKTLGSDPVVKVSTSGGDVDPYTDGAVFTYTWSYKIGESGTSTSKDSDTLAAAAIGQYYITCKVEADTEDYEAATSEEQVVEINEPEHYVFVTPDYVAGSTAIYVFVNGNARVKYSGNKVYEITNLGYQLTGETKKAINGKSNNAATTGYHVYAYIAAGAVTEAAAKNNITFVKYNEKLLGSLDLIDYRNVNEANGVDLSDAVVINDAFANEKTGAKLTRYLAGVMGQLFRADVDGDGDIDAADATDIEAVLRGYSN